MKVFGKFMGGYNSANFAVGGYAAFDVEWIHVETYTAASVEEDRRCFLKLGASFMITEIKRADGSYLDPETANALLIDIASKEAVCWMGMIWASLGSGMSGRTALPSGTSWMNTAIRSRWKWNGYKFAPATQ